MRDAQNIIHIDQHIFIVLKPIWLHIWPHPYSIQHNQQYRRNNPDHVMFLLGDFVMQRHWSSGHTVLSLLLQFDHDTQDQTHHRILDELFLYKRSIEVCALYISSHYIQII
jgi:hypothetical protein